MKQLTKLFKAKKLIEDKTSLNIKELLEWIKCKRSFRYFCKTYIKLPEAEEDIPFVFNECQEHLINQFFKKHFLVVNKSRQIGISTVCQALCVYFLLFFKNITIGVISRDKPEAIEFVMKVSHMIDKLPQFFVPPKEKDRFSSIRFALPSKGGTGSELKSGWVNLSKPESVLRGPAITFLIIDEAAFILKVKEAFTGINAATSKAQKVAKKRNVPFGTIIISTPNKTEGMGEWFYKEFLDGMKPGSLFQSLLLHWSFIKEYTKNKKWYLEQCKQYKFKWEDIDQEFNCLFLPGSRDSLISIETARALNLIHGREKKKIRNYKNEVGEFKIFDYFDPSKRYIISFDTATKTGSSFSTIQVCDFETLKQVAEYQGKLSILKFPDIIESILEFYPLCIIVGEYNTINQSVCDYFAQHKKWKNHLYVEKRYNKKQKVTKIFNGVYTDNVSRPKMIESLNDIIEEDPSRVLSTSLKFELLGLKEKNGRMVSNSTTDLCMAYAFACYLKVYHLYKDIPVVKNGLLKQISNGKFVTNDHNIEDAVKVILLDDNVNNINRDYLPKRIYNKYSE